MGGASPPTSTTIEIAVADRLYAIIGGLHFIGLPEARVKEAAEYLRQKNPELVVGTHYTGIAGVAALQAVLPTTAKSGGVGVSIHL